MYVKVHQRRVERFFTQTESIRKSALIIRKKNTDESYPFMVYFEYICPIQWFTIQFKNLKNNNENVIMKKTQSEN